MEGNLDFHVGRSYCLCNKRKHVSYYLYSRLSHFFLLFCSGGGDQPAENEVRIKGNATYSNSTEMRDIRLQV